MESIALKIVGIVTIFRVTMLMGRAYVDAFLDIRGLCVKKVNDLRMHFRQSLSQSFLKRSKWFKVGGFNTYEVIRHFSNKWNEIYPYMLFSFLKL